MKFRLIEQRTNKFDLDEALGLKEGISKNMSAEDIAKKHGVSVSKIKAQLVKGIEVEKEHTKDEKKAERIALDHLFEIPNYYDKLAKMEKSALKESVSTKKPYDTLTWEEKELADYLFDEYKEYYGRHNDFLSVDLPDFDDLKEEIHEYYSEDISDTEIKNVIKALTSGVEEVEIYEGEIQLDDSPVLNYIHPNIPENSFDEFDEIYWIEVDNWLERFEKENNIEVSYAGRGGRHIITPMNAESYINFDYLKDKYDELQSDFVDYMNNINLEESLKEDTIKQNGKWVNKGKEGTHGTFRTKKAADQQRKAMFANSGKNRNFGESLLKEDTDINHYRDMIKRLDRAERSLLQARNEIFDILEINDNSTGTFNTALEVLKDDIHKGYDKLFDLHFANPDEYSKQFREEKINEALYNDEVQEFVNKARKLGARTYEDLIKILLNDPASVGNKDIEKLRNYYKVANPDDKTLSNDVVTESLNQKSLKTAIEKKIREHFKDWEDEEYDELIKDYLYIDIVPTEDGRTKVEVRCELSYDTLDEIADELNPIIQKLDKDAYFDHEDAGIINAFLNQKIEENLNESQMQEIAQAYRDLSKEYGVDIKELVYGVDGFMQERYPNGFPDFKGDIIFSEEYWEEFEDWCKERGIKLEKLTNEKLIQGKSEETVRKNTETEIKDTMKKRKLECKQ